MKRMILILDVHDDQFGHGLRDNWTAYDHADDLLSASGAYLYGATIIEAKWEEDNRGI